ncbi:MAG: hypothetical protein RLZZ401_337, partial [Pseudomonadota bacterium]
EPPKLAYLNKTEEDYWIGRAQMSPGYELTQLQATLTRRTNAFSTTAAMEAH